MSINIFYRKKEIDRHSIEKVYNTLLPFFSSFEAKIVEVPFKSKGFLNRVLNIVYAAFNQAKINHISGDIHYINLFMSTRKNILTIHDIYPILRTTGIKKYILKWLWFEIPIKKSRKIITISEFSKAELIRHFKIPQDKIKVIHNCISPYFKPSKKPFNTSCPTILHIGTKKNKNLENLIEAIKGLSVKLVIVGELNTEQQQKISSYNIDYRNLKNVSNTELIDLYDETDIVSFVSTYEGFGLPIIESQAMGKVVITSNVASMPEIAGDGALLVNPDSSEELKRSIIQLTKNTELRSDLILKGFENVKRFEPKKIAKQYIKLYNEILN